MKLGFKSWYSGWGGQTLNHYLLLSISRPLWGKMLNIHSLDLAPWIFQNLITYSFKNLSCNSANYKELNLWWMRFKYFCCSSPMVKSFQIIESSVSLNLTIFYCSHSSYFSIINPFQILHENKPCSQGMTKTLLLLEAGKYFC